MSNEQTIECSNAPCNCEVTVVMGTEGYCSDSCRAADEGEEMEFCECGHPPCDVE